MLASQEPGAAGVVVGNCELGESGAVGPGVWAPATWRDALCFYYDFGPRFVLCQELYQF